MLTLTAVLQILKQELDWSPELLGVIQAWLLGITAVGTWDKGLVKK